MKHYVLTGAPGSGKTTVLRELQRRGWSAVDEAATDVIAREQERGVREPWRDPVFAEKVVALQQERLRAAAATGVGVCLHDRAPWCAVALARYLGLPVSAALLDAVELAHHHYEKTAFFLRPLGFVEPTAVRRISYEDALEFETAHEAVYRAHGFALVDVPAGAVAERASAVEARLPRPAAGAPAVTGPDLDPVHRQWHDPHRER